MYHETVSPRRAGLFPVFPLFPLFPLFLPSGVRQGDRACYSFTVL
ncbi:hypothetical protein SXCC_02534 [Gluconacetobacter sp. SXCC-1]|nr:hypothetical protein SXCC_02534 [Gluconacetobacter sp. SXCC-1]